MKRLVVTNMFSAVLMTVLGLQFICGGEAVASPILAGDDSFSSTGEITIEILDPFFPGGFTETIQLHDEGIAAVVHRETQVGTTIETEITSLRLVGISAYLGPLTVRVGADRGVQPSLGAITDVVQDESDPGFPGGEPSSFASGDSFFDVFFEIDVPGTGTAYNTTPHRLGPETIYSLPPIGTTYVSPGVVELFLDVPGTGDPMIGYVGPVSHSVVPAPGAMLLGAIGAGLVGWLRRRGVR